MIRSAAIGLLALAVALGIAGCAGQSAREQEAAESAAVTGTVTYLQRSALPPDATVVVRLEDVSLADAPAKLIGEEEIASAGRQVPIPFSVRYDPKVIDPRHNYAVSAQIMQEDRLLFISDTQHRVITQGNPDKVDILVRPAS